MMQWKLGVDGEAVVYMIFFSGRVISLRFFFFFFLVIGPWGHY